MNETRSPSLHPSEIIWIANKGQQTFALQRKEREILYGGARGG